MFLQRTAFYSDAKIGVILVVSIFIIDNNEACFPLNPFEL